MNDLVNIVGVTKGVSAKGSAYTVLHIVSDFDDYMISKGALGQKAENIYVLGDFSVEIGKQYQLIYSRGFGGKAIVTGVMPVNNK